MKKKIAVALGLAVIATPAFAQAREEDVTRSRAEVFKKMDMQHCKFCMSTGEACPYHAEKAKRMGLYDELMKLDQKIEH